MWLVYLNRHWHVFGGMGSSSALDARLPLTDSSGGVWLCSCAFCGFMTNRKTGRKTRARALLLVLLLCAFICSVTKTVLLHGVDMNENMSNKRMRGADAGHETGGMALPPPPMACVNPALSHYNPTPPPPFLHHYPCYHPLSTSPCRQQTFFVWWCAEQAAAELLSMFWLVRWFRDWLVLQRC